MIENISLLINALPLPVFIQDVKGVYLDCNDRFASYLEKNKSEIIGKTIYDLVDDEKFADQVFNINAQLIAKAENTGGRYSWAGHSLTKTFKSFIINKSLLRDHKGDLIGIIGTITDTENIKNIGDDLIRTNNVISERGLDKDALRLLNHEFRTPMNVISGLTEILYKQEKSEEEKSLLWKIKANNERLLKLITNILQIAEIESDSFNLDPEVLNIGSLIDSIVFGFEPLAKEKNINLIYSEDNSISDEIFASRFALTVIVSNLLSNAIKFSNKGDIIILLRKIMVNKGEYAIELSVHDEGIGIPQNKINDIFNKYVQLKLKDEPFFNGAGLGLNIVQQIVEALHGKIKVESEVGKGSNFTIVFPISTR